MKHLNKTLFLLLVALLLLTFTGCVPRFDNGLVIGESYRLESGETLNTDLTVIGGNAVLEEDSRVNGDVAVIGGNVTVSGSIEGDVSVMGGNVTLDDTAVVEGDLSTMGGSVQRSPQAVVEGRETRGGPGSITTMRTPGVSVSFDPITGPLMAIFQALATAALALLVNLFAARQMDMTGRTAVAQPIITGGVGLLTIVVAPALLLIMAITLILIPVSLLGFLLLGIAGLFGWLSLGLILGRQISFWLKQSWTDPVNAGAGTLALSLISSMLNLIPCLGWLANLLIALIGLGAVLLTRFGTQPYPSTFAPAPRPASPAPYMATEPPIPSGARVYEVPDTDVREVPDTDTTGDRS